MYKITKIKDSKIKDVSAESHLKEKIMKYKTSLMNQKILPIDFNEIKVESTSHGLLIKLVNTKSSPEYLSPDMKQELRKSVDYVIKSIISKDSLYNYSIKSVSIGTIAYELSVNIYVNATKVKDSKIKDAKWELVAYRNNKKIDKKSFETFTNLYSYFERKVPTDAMVVVYKDGQFLGKNPQDIYNRGLAKDSISYKITKLSVKDEIKESDLKTFVKHLDSSSMYLKALLNEYKSSDKTPEFDNDWYKNYYLRSGKASFEKAQQLSKAIFK